MKYRSTFHSLFVVASLMLLACGADAGSNELVHFEGEPKEFKLNSDQKSQLDGGNAVFVKNSSDQWGLAVFRVNAPETKVWQTIQNFDQYPAMIPEITISSRYKDDSVQNGRKTINIKFQLQKSFVFTVTRNYYVVHNFPADNRGWGTWHTDGSKDDENEIYSIGYWRVKPVEGNPGQSEVTYYIKLRLRYGTDNFLRNYIMDSGLRQATQWVKEFSE